MLGIISGTLPLAAALQRSGRTQTCATPYGDVILTIADEMCILDRHVDGAVPPHKIEHRANIKALADRCDAIIGISSAGSMNPGITPGTIVVPDDFIHLDPPSFFEKDAVHTVPGLDEKLRKSILAACQDLGVTVRNGAVYYQTKGPRLETPAEIRMMSRFADLVGMTAASEATLAIEAEIPYAFICSADNWANGIGGVTPDYTSIVGQAKKNMDSIIEIVGRLTDGV